MTSRYSLRSKLNLGFSLIEILVVIAILGIVLAMTVPAITGLANSSRLNTAGNALVDQLNYARQIAVSRNLPVEFRFYEGETTSGNGIVGFQGFTLNNDGTYAPISRLIRLPNEIAGSLNNGLSSLAKCAPSTDTSAKVPSDIKSNMAFEFRPDGSTDLPLNEKWYITLGQTREVVGPTASGQPPDNFFCVMVNPVSGKAKIFRP